VAQPCVNCGREPKAPGRGNKYCVTCKPIMRETLMERERRKLLERNEKQKLEREEVSKKRKTQMNRFAPEGKRYCYDCEDFLPLSRFSSRPGSKCRTCLKFKDHEWMLKSRFGLSKQEYMDILDSQGGVCYICERKPVNRRLAVDHDHSTGNVRGLLCKGCNRDILGHLRDDPAALQRAIDYLHSPPAFDVIGERPVPNGVPPV